MNLPHRRGAKGPSATLGPVPSRKVVIVLVAAVGVALAAGLTHAASTLVSQPIGLEGERESIGDALAPATTAAGTATTTAPDRTTTAPGTSTSNAGGEGTATAVGPVSRGDGERDEDRSEGDEDEDD